MPIDENALYTVIGKRIRRQRKTAEITQDQLAEKIGVTRTSITNIEAGTQKLSIYLLYKIAGVLDLEIEAILPVVSDVEVDLLETLDLDGSTMKISPSAASFVREAMKDLSDDDI